LTQNQHQRPPIPNTISSKIATKQEPPPCKDRDEGTGANPYVKAIAKAGTVTDPTDRDRVDRVKASVARAVYIVYPIAGAFTTESKKGIYCFKWWINKVN